MNSSHQITFDFNTEQGSESKKRGRKPKDPTVIIKKLPGKKGRKSLKEAEADAGLIQIPGDDVLFSKQYYSMREVAAMLRINHSLLRFWENEFDVLQPKKNKKGDRLFRPADVKTLHLIYYLIRQRKYTMEGAKEYLKNDGTGAEKKFQIVQTLQRIKDFLLELKAGL